MGKQLKPLLTRQPLYKGEDVDDAREVLSTMFTEVTVDPLTAGGAYSTTVNGIELPRSIITYCEYPHGMIAGPRAELDFHTIQLNLSGSARFNISGIDVDGDMQKSVMLSSGEKVKVRHEPGNAILSYIVKDDVLHDVISTYIDHERNGPIKFSPNFDPKDPRTASLLSFLNNFVEELNRPGGVLESPAAVASFEHTLITFMLFGLDHNYRDVLLNPAPMISFVQVKDVEDYLRAHASLPLTMDLVASATGYSVNTIFRAFKKHRNYTPMQFFRNVRMEMARQRLLYALPGETVSQIAMQCGFSHLGRFSIEYKKRFGESPGQTLNNLSRPSH